MSPPTPPSSETTSLLPEGSTGGCSCNSCYSGAHNSDNAVGGNADSSRGPLELDPEGSAPWRPRRRQERQQRRRSPKTAKQIALEAAMVAILALVISVPFLKTMMETRNNSNGATQESHGSLLSPKHHWSDEDFHAWEDFLANGHRPQGRQPSSLEIDMEIGGPGRLSPATPNDLEQSAATMALAASQANGAGGTLLYFNRSEAFSMVDPVESDFFHYQRGWEAQITQALCSIATTAALLNSLKDAVPGLALPVDPTYRPFPWATQRFLLESAEDDPCVRAALGGTVENARAVYHMGLGLSMVPRLMNCVLRSGGYEAVPHPAADESGKSATKERVLRALRDPASRVVYNYDRGGVGQGPRGHGHWSPIGAYHAPTDSFLVMDVAKYKHPMVWVSWEQLWSGAATIDNCGETLSIDTNIDWSVGFAGIGTNLRDYLHSRCVPGHRGFVIVSPAAE